MGMNPDQRLRKAIEAGDLSRVRRALAAGADPNGRYADPRGGGLRVLDEAPALMLAASAGLLEITAALLEAGAEIDETGTTYISYDPDDDDVPYAWKTALTVALEQGHHTLAQLLIERGANPRLEAPVCSAAQAGTLELVQQLVARGGSPSQVDHNAHSPLYWAADGGHLAIMDWLHTSGGRFARHIDLEDARASARKGRRRKVVLWLKEKTDRGLLDKQYSIWRADVKREDFKAAFGELVSAMAGTALEWSRGGTPKETVTHPEGWKTERRWSVNLRLGPKKVRLVRTETTTNFETRANHALRDESTLTLVRAAPVQMRYCWTEKQKHPVVVLSCHGAKKALDRFDRALREATLSFTVEWVGDSDYVADFRG